MEGKYFKRKALLHTIIINNAKILFQGNMKESLFQFCINNKNN